MEKTVDGARVVSKNLIFDKETGAPVLTSTTNEWDEEVYSYNYPAHYHYKGMKAMSNNYRALVNIKQNNSAYNLQTSTQDINEISDILQKGDILVSNGIEYQVNNIITTSTPNTFELIDISNGSTVSGLSSGDYQILNSGYANLTSLSMGNIVSLTNPLDQFSYVGKIKLLCEAINNDVSSIQENCDSEKWIRNDETDDKFFSFKLGTSDCIIKIEPETGAFSCTVNKEDITFDISSVSFNGTEYSVNISYDCSGVITYQKMIIEIPTNGCASKCMNVLSASAIEYSNQWVYKYIDAGISSNGSKYWYENEQKWKAKKSWAYTVNRLQQGTKGSGSDISKDGEYSIFTEFIWDDPINSISDINWKSVNEVTLYSPFGFELENKNALNIKSAALYGYDKSLPTAIGSNVSYFELAYDGFEEYIVDANDESLVKKGHLDFGTVKLTNTAHTGSQALHIPSDGYTITLGQTEFFTPNSSTDYLISAWVYTRNNAKLEISLISSGTISTVSDFNEIDGWTKIEAKVSLNGTTAIKFAPDAQSQFVFVDDIRICPFEGSMVSYVYNPIDHKLLAELDGLNYATFYNYNESGQLVQVKKETDNGIVTVKSGRNNISQRTQTP